MSEDIYHKSHSVSVRKIDNGYVKSTTTSDGGDYHCKEEFSRQEPKLEAREPRQVGSRGSSLRDAVKVLRSGR